MTRPAADQRPCVLGSPEREPHDLTKGELAALEEYAGSHGYLVPPEWRFQDEGYSGAAFAAARAGKLRAIWRRQVTLRWSLPSTRPTD